ncbi:MAG: hypothetical protein AAB456_00570 [Patescibacteria group bacterium]
MELEIKKEWPPNIEEIRKVLKLEETVVFTYGSVLYNPTGNEIAEHLLAHENVHAFQQKWNSDEAKIWWQRYLDDVEFRLEQELEAYVAQYVYIKNTRNSKVSEEFLDIIAGELSSSLYGNIINYPRAKTLIRHRAR